MTCAHEQFRYSISTLGDEVVAGCFCCDCGGLLGTAADSLRLPGWMTEWRCEWCTRPLLECMHDGCNERVLRKETAEDLSRRASGGQL